MRFKSLLLSIPFVLMMMFVLRLATLGFPDLIDTTDARYASIAANMAIDDDWVVPYVHQERQMMSYWSKPPLSFWIQAGAIQLFGFNEWAVRLPSLLWLSLMVAFTAWIAERWIGERYGGLTAVLTGGTTLVFVLASMTMTDQPLAAVLVGALIGFGLFFETLNPWWARIGFFFLGLSLLAKGPIGLMIPCASLGLFVLLSNQWGKLWKIPWGTGLLVMLLVATPWYLLMEQRSPGFLNYFLLEENFNRLISSNLVLRHGTAHETFRGVGLLCFIVATVPWIFIFPWMVKRVGWKALLPQQVSGVARNRELFLLCWFLGPLIPFAIGKQVLPYYLLPLTSGFILWFVAVAKRLELLRPSGLVLTASVSTLIVSIGMMVMGPLFLNEKRSSKAIIEELVEDLGDAHTTITFANRIPDSAHFYMASDVSNNLRFATISLDKIRAERGPKLVVVRQKDVSDVPLVGYRERLHLRKYVLYERDPT